MTTTTTERSTQSRLAIRLAVPHLRRLKRAHADYQEEVDAWYRSGDGRSPNWRTDITDDGEVYQWNAGGRGYRFPHCIHGRSLWVDHDIPCGACEDGYTVYELALGAGWTDARTYLDRLSVWQYASDQSAPEHITEQLMEWALALLEPLQTPPTRRRLP